jgi:hypothetical protein
VSPISILRRLVRFVLSIRFGVLLLLFLMFVMMYATQFEASTSTRAMKRYIYGSAWFDAGVFLFVINIIVNTWRRRPFRFRHVGFLTVHIGVLVIVAGGLTTRWFGLEGTMPIPEGSSSDEILLPESDLVVETDAGRLHHETEYDLRPWEEEHEDLFRVPGTPYWVEVRRYFPTGVVVDTLLDDAAEENPIVRVAFAAPHASPVRDWLLMKDPARNALESGNVRLVFVEEASLDSLRREWTEEKEEGEGALFAGTLELFWADGAHEGVRVPREAGARLATSRPGVEVEVVRVFRAFTLTEEGAIDSPHRSENPAIHFRVRHPDGVEDHYAFTNFPEFRPQPPEGETWILDHAAWKPEAEALRAAAPRLEVALVREAPGRFRTYTSWGDSLDGRELALGEERLFSGHSVFLSVLEAAERGRLLPSVKKASEEIMRPVVRVRLVETVEEEHPLHLASLFHILRGRPPVRPVPVEPNEAWIFHGESHEFQTPRGGVRVAYRRRTIPLDFSIRLEDFREETYPGTALAASYESDVIVEPRDGEPFAHRIYMNHPLRYAGYTFYQASFQRTPDGREITVLSVARDPGMRISFFGYWILVIGLILIFFAKPYFRRLDDRIARSRVARAEGA